MVRPTARRKTLVGRSARKYASAHVTAARTLSLLTPEGHAARWPLSRQPQAAKSSCLVGGNLRLSAAWILSRLPAASRRSLGHGLPTVLATGPSMLWLLAQLAVPTMSVEMALSAASAVVTGYFWLVRARQERPNLKIFQLRDFRATLRSREGEKKAKRLSLTPMETGGVLVANNSLRQNSIVRFDCYVQYEQGWLKGSWGYLNDDKPPWNIPPNSSIAISPACFFDVPEDFTVGEELPFRVEFITASGRRFAHRFSLKAPEL
jgi:hypothetical protein